MIPRPARARKLSIPWGSERSRATARRVALALLLQGFRARSFGFGYCFAQGLEVFHLLLESIDEDDLHD